jgi:hypothetical protein
MFFGDLDLLFQCFGAVSPDYLIFFVYSLVTKAPDMRRCVRGYGLLIVFCFSQFSFYFLLTPPSILGKALALGLDQALSSWSVSNVVLLFLLLGQACGTWSATWLLVRHSM